MVNFNKSMTIVMLQTAIKFRKTTIISIGPVISDTSEKSLFYRRAKTRFEDSSTFSCR